MGDTGERAKEGLLSDDLAVGSQHEGATRNSPDSGLLGQSLTTSTSLLSRAGGSADCGTDASFDNPNDAVFQPSEEESESRTTPQFSGSISIGEGCFKTPTTDDDSDFPFVLLTPNQVVDCGGAHPSRDDGVADDFPFILKTPDDVTFSGRTGLSPIRFPDALTSRSSPSLHLGGEAPQAMIRPRCRSWPSIAPQIASDISRQALEAFNFVSLSDDAGSAFHTPVNPVLVPGKAISAMSYNATQNVIDKATTQVPSSVPSQVMKAASMVPQKRGNMEMRMTDQETCDFLGQETTGSCLGFSTPPPSTTPPKVFLEFPARREKKIRGLDLPRKPGQHREEK